MTTRSWSPWAIAAAGVTAVFLLANHLLVLGRAVGAWDAEEQAFPFFTLVADHARAGRFVTWDPWTTAGLPIMGEPQVAVFSPLTNLVALVTGGGAFGYVLYWLLIWWLGGIGMLLLARHLGAPAWGAAVVALGYIFSGVYASNAEHMSWIVGFSFIPWIVWRLDAGLVAGRWLPVVQAGALWGLSGLTGYPGLVILTGGFTALWSAGRLLDRARPARVLLAPAIVLIVGVVVLSPTYVAFFHEGAGVHSRVGQLTRDDARSDQFDPAAVVTLATPWPAALKASARNVLFPSSDVSMTNIYAGLVVPVLALLALTMGRRWRWYLAVLALLALAAAMGETLPLRGWLYDLFLPLRYFRHSSIFRLYFVFTLCVLAALGAADLARALAGDRRVVRRMVLITCGAAAAAVAGTAIFTWHAWSLGLTGRRAALYAAGWLVLAAALLVARRLPTARLSRVVPAVLLLVAAVDGAMVMRISRPTMIRQGEAFDRWIALDARHSTSLDLTENGLFRTATACDSVIPVCKRYDQMISKVPTFDTYTSQRHAMHRAMVGDPVLAAAALGAERSWFASDVAHLPPARPAFDAFTARAGELGAPPVVVHDRAAMLAGDETPGAGTAADASDSAARRAIAALPAAEPASVEVLDYEPKRLALRYAAPADGWLLVTDRWARSWRAQVNGVETPVNGGNFVFRAVPVTAGVNVVEFSYRPALYPLLVVVSWLALAAVVMAAPVTSRFRGWRRRSESASGGTTPSARSLRR